MAPPGPYSGTSTLALVARASAFTVGLIYGSMKLSYIKLTSDIHEEVESHNPVLDHMGNAMDASRGILSGTMDRFKMVFETKSGLRLVVLVGGFVIAFLIIYFLTK